MSTQSIGSVKYHLIVLLVGLLLAASALAAPVVVEQISGLSLTPAAHACGGQSGGC